MPSDEINGISAQTRLQMDTPIQPQILIRDKLLRNCKQAELASRLGITPAALSMVLSGKRQISSNLAIRLGVLSGDGTEFWRRVQQLWEDWVHQSREPRAGDIRKSEISLEAPIGGLLFEDKIKRAIDLDLLKIDPFNPSRLRIGSYACSIGSVFGVDKYREKIECNNGSFTLPPRELLQVITKEKFFLSSRIMGRMGMTADLVDYGIFVSFALRIDPGYSGHLYVALENRLSVPNCIYADEELLLVEFYYMPDLTERSRERRSEVTFCDLSGSVDV